MPTRIVSLALFVLLLLSGVPAFADVKDLMQQGDTLYRQRQNMDKARQAAECYNEALKLDPENIQAAVKLSYTWFYIGNEAPQRKERVHAYQESAGAAGRAVEAAPQAVQGWLLRGAAHALLLGETNNIGLLPGVLSDLAQAGRIAPEFSGGGSDRVLGRLYHKLPGILGGSYNKSLRHFEKAMTLGPGYWQNHLYLAELYIDLKRYDEAAKLLDQVLIGEPIPDMEPECRIWKERAKELMEVINRKS